MVSSVDRCGFCGYEYHLDRAVGASQGIVDGTAAIAERLISQNVERLRARPRPETWSPLEYGCHVRDVLLVQRERVLAARRTNRPTFDPMGRDERVEHDGYRVQQPGDVARQLRDAALMFTHVLGRLSPDEWSRTVTYNYPQRQERSLAWVAVHTEHEVLHHLRDIEMQLTGSSAQGA
jgi:hypothetical protein